LEGTCDVKLARSQHALRIDRMGMGRCPEREAVTPRVRRTKPQIPAPWKSHDAMIRYPVRVTLLGLALTSSVLIMVAAGSQVAQDPVYSVAQVQASLARHPSVWLRRTVRVRGVASECAYAYASLCTSWQPVLRDPATRPGEPGAELLLLPVPARPDALTALLRRIPWVRALVRGPHVVQWGVAATYQVQLRVMAGSHCGGGPCYEALLLDAAPGPG
jgi:hypothetical protein